VAEEEISINSLLYRIEDIAGKDFFEATNTSYNTVLTRYCREGVRDVVDRTLQQNPKDMHLFCQNLFIKNLGTWADPSNELTFSEFAVPWKDADGGFFIDNNYILWVARYFGGIKVPAHEISAEKGLKVEDPESIYYTGDDFRNPIWYRSSSKLYIYPDISVLEEGFCSMVKFDDRFLVTDDKIGYFPQHLLFLVVIYAATRGLKLVKAQNRTVYTTSYSTPVKVWATLYPDQGLPTLPAFPTDLVDFGTENSTFPEMDLPDITDDSVENPETVNQVFANMWNRINEEEETDLFSAEVSRFNTMLSEYNNRVQTLEKRNSQELTKFQSELAFFSSQYQTVMDAWQRYQSSYQIELGLLDSEIARLEKDYFSYFYPKHYLDKTKEEGNY